MSQGIIIFDMDGTLIDSMPQHAAAFAQILETQFGITPQISRKAYMQTAGQPLDEQFSAVVSTSKGIQIKDMDLLLDQFWQLVLQSTPKLFLDTVPAIKALSQAGYTLVVFSGCAPHVVAAKLVKSDLAQYFKLMLGTDKNIPGLIKGKEHFTIITQTLHLTPTDFQANTLLVGDAEHDMKLAKEARLLGIARITKRNGDSLTRAGASFLINDLFELTALLRDIETPNRLLTVSEFRSRGDASMDS